MRFSLSMTLLAVVFFLSAQKYEEPIYTVSGQAIKGYDPVAFFSDEKATIGSNEYPYEWSGSIWLFASQSNLEKFKSNPEKYAPQYGGYCAWGMSKGYKAKVDPEKAWTIVEGKLYLNYNAGVQKKWLPEKEELIKVADKNWKDKF